MYTTVRVTTKDEQVFEGKVTDIEYILSEECEEITIDPLVYPEFGEVVYGLKDYEIEKIEILKDLTPEERETEAKLWHAPNEEYDPETNT